MRKCILSEDNREYNPKTQFVSYVVQHADKTRILIFQYKNTGDENFSYINLFPKNEQTPTTKEDKHQSQRLFGGEQQQFGIRREIIDAKHAVALMQSPDSFYHMEILPKTSMDAINRIIDTGDFIRSNTLVSATKWLTDRINGAIKGGTGLTVEINPIELVLSTADRVADKIADDRPLCLIL